MRKHLNRLRRGALVAAVLLVGPIHTHPCGYGFDGTAGLSVQPDGLRSSPIRPVSGNGGAWLGEAAWAAGSLLDVFGAAPDLGTPLY